MADRPRMLHDMQPLMAGDPRQPEGIVWRLAEGGRQLDANVVHLPAGQRIGEHAEPDLDVLFVVVAGSGTLTCDDGPIPLTPGALVWLPRGSARSIAAGDNGVGYLTVHQRRPGMQIRFGSEAR